MRKGPVSIVLLATFLLLRFLAVAVTARAATVCRDTTCGSYPSDFGALGDDVHDDSAALKAAIANAASSCTSLAPNYNNNQGRLVLASRATYKISQTITIPAHCVEFDGNGGTIDARGMPEGSVAILVTTPQNSYSSMPVRNLHVIGHGGLSSSIGVLIAGNNIEFDNLQVARLGQDVQFGNYAYTITFLHPFLTGDGHGNGMYFPPTVKGGGESIRIIGGSIANDGHAIVDGGLNSTNTGAEFYIEAASLDGQTDSPILNYNGQVSMTNVHIERLGPISKSPIIENGLWSCNAFTFVDMKGGTILVDGGNPSVSALIDSVGSHCGGAGTWVKLTDVFVNGVYPASACVAGSGASCVTGNQAGQVKIEGSTNGTWGGTMDNLELHPGFQPNP